MDIFIERHWIKKVTQQRDRFPVSEHNRRIKSAMILLRACDNVGGAYKCFIGVAREVFIVFQASGCLRVCCIIIVRG